MNGKGSSPRPMTLTPERWADAWQRTFGSGRPAPLEETARRVLIEQAQDAARGVDRTAAA